MGLFFDEEFDFGLKKIFWLQQKNLASERKFPASILYARIVRNRKKQVLSTIEKHYI